MPFISQVAVGKREKLSVFGNDHNTKDGTGVRDYIHVVDLVLGNLAALNTLRESSGLLKANLGTGQGYSVLEMIEAFKQASSKPIPYEFVSRRPGDIAACYAFPALAKEVLGWEVKHTL
jgi:UDP-glucose 4-epimerase